MTHASDEPQLSPAVTVTAPRRPFSHLAEAAIGRLLFRRTALQPGLVASLRREAASLDGNPLEATELWNEQRARLREFLLHGDPATFLRWTPVRTTMVKRGHAPIVHELAHLRARADWRTRWRPVLRETTLGTPRPFPRWPWSSASLIHDAYHACRFEETTGMPLAGMQLIVEFGGGYGRLCHLVHDLGFSGRYVILDLPEVAVLQRFYLRHVGIAVTPAVRGAWPATGAVTAGDLADVDTLLRRRSADESAFIAIGSLSEAPLALRDRVLAAVAPFDAFLLYYSAHLESIDNRAYFAAWRARLSEHEWREMDLPHLGKASTYLFGRRRRNDGQRLKTTVSDGG